MKKIIYIFAVMSLIFASCEKQIIKPSSSVENESIERHSVSGEFYDSSLEVDMLNNSNEKSGIIDPNSRDDIGGRKGKNSK